jgi:hypothetical protein
MSKVKAATKERRVMFKTKIKKMKKKRKKKTMRIHPTQSRMPTMR